MKLKNQKSSSYNIKKCKFTLLEPMIVNDSTIAKKEIYSGKFSHQEKRMATKKSSAVLVSWYTPGRRARNEENKEMTKSCIQLEACLSH